MSEISESLNLHQRALRECDRCPSMIGPVVVGHPVASSVFLIGQAPGAKEGGAGKPFAWTAGKTLFKWFNEIGLGEDQFRERVYMAAVCRCFPGKNPKGGDRVPNQSEMAACAMWMDAELTLLKPRLILPVGKLAISRLLPVKQLKDVIGQCHRFEFKAFSSDVIPLPHPSGASTWHRMEPGKTLLSQALKLVSLHPAWREICY